MCSLSDNIEGSAVGHGYLVHFSSFGGRGFVFGRAGFERCDVGGGSVILPALESSAELGGHNVDIAEDREGWVARVLT